LDLWNAIYLGRWLLIGSVIISVSLAAYYANTAPKIYKAETLLQPTSEGSSSGLGGSSLGGFAALAGINLGGGDKSTSSLAILESREFARSFIQKHNLLKDIFSEEWDSSTESWVSGTPPKLWDAVDVLRNDIRSINLDVTTGLIKLSIEWTDPKKAADWVRWMLEDINNSLREKAGRKANQNLEYLKSEFENIELSNMRNAIVSLMEREIEKKMTANVRKEFAFSTLDSVETPPIGANIKPRKAIILALGFVFGGFLGVVLVIFLFINKKRPPSLNK
jgi:uncharacterized protein involved in exopolysaccharide biosynthesis